MNDRHGDAKKPMHAAVVGCGYWGPNHIRTMTSLGCQVTAVDQALDRLDRVAAQFPQATARSRLEDVLEDDSIGAVIVATPTATHFDIARRALESGKHVLCEKPLCTRAADARELVALSEQRRLVLMTGHVFLFNAAINKIRDLLQSGELGEVRYLSAVRTNLGPIRGDVNAAVDLATHDISIFNWLLGDSPAAVSATGGAFVQPALHDVVFVNLRYPGGAVASIHASWLNPKKVRQITIVGSERMVTWDDLSLATPVAIYESGARTVPEATDYGESLRISMWEGDVRLPKVSPEEPLKAQARAFLAAVERGRPERSGGAFSLEVVAALEAIERSLALGGAPVELTGAPP